MSPEARRTIVAAVQVARNLRNWAVAVKGYTLDGTDAETLNELLDYVAQLDVMIRAERIGEATRSGGTCYACNGQHPTATCSFVRRP